MTTEKKGIAYWTGCGRPEVCLHLVGIVVWIAFVLGFGLAMLLVAVAR
jgi:hypothetical protein